MKNISIKLIALIFGPILMFIYIASKAIESISEKGLTLIEKNLKEVLDKEALNKTN